MARSSWELVKRVLVALVGIPVAVAVAYLGGAWLTGLLALLAALAAWEFAAMYRSQGVASVPVLAGGLAGAYLVLAAVASVEQFAGLAAVLTLAVGVWVLLTTPADSRPGLAVMVTMFAAFYTGLLLAFALGLRGIEADGPGWRGAGILFLPIAITWLGDTAAYFTGRAIGRRKLAPSISPGKTWEGAIAGFLATTGGAWLFVELTGGLVGWTLSTAAVLGLGAAVAVGGQLGDLFESRFKRDCGVKDSSQLLPGHGGMLDRLDSLLFAFPLAYAYLSLAGV